MRTAAVIGLLLLAWLHTVVAAAGPTDAEQEFRRATSLLQAGDAVSAVAIYRTLAGQGHETASLYWNWAQAAQRLGAPGQAMWALLRARELEPGDRAVAREVERLRELCGLDPAELSPQPFAALPRLARRLHLDVVAVILAALSVGFHALARWQPARRWPPTAAWAVGAAALIAATVPVAGALAKPVAVVVHRGAPLLDAAAPTATTLAPLREGEVVPVLETAGAFLRVQDSSGSRGWARASQVWRLDSPPPPP